MLTLFPVQETKEWLKRHHIYKPPSRENGNQEIHVFAVQRGAVYDKSSDDVCYDVEFPLGPITLVFEICISGNSISVCVYIKVPILGRIKLGCVEGTLDGGVTISINYLDIVKGSLTFYVKDGWLWVHWELTIFGTKYEGDTALIPLP